MKTCCICEEAKHNDEFRNSGKTIDGKHPYCKKCIVISRIHNRSSLETIILQQWNDILDLSFTYPVGTVLHTNKKIFIEYVRSLPKFSRLYKEWLTYEYGDMKLECFLKQPKLTQPFQFDNFDFKIRELQEGETLKVVRGRPVVRV